VLAATVAAAGVALFSRAPIPQPESYHAFADARPWLGVPNFQNVATNAPFLFVGAAGLAATRRAAFGDAGLRRAYAVFFVAVAAVAFGSGWYHMAPTTQSLFWDRLPMSVAFGALCAALIGERLSVAMGRALLAPLVLACVASVVWWRVTEERGHGDLRAYVLAQALPLFCIVVLVAPRPRRDDGTLDFALLLAWYAAAKLLETFDVEVFRATGGAVSGHALKHLAAAGGVGQIALLMRRRAAGR
jgi:hypothetical protein